MDHRARWLALGMGASALTTLVSVSVAVRARRKMLHAMAERHSYTQSMPLRTIVMEKLIRSRDAWDRSVLRFRTLYWLCLTGVIVLPTCLASLKDYISPLPAAILSVGVAIFGAVQAIVKPYDKFMRDIEFRDEADYLLRQAEVTTQEPALKKIMRQFETVERRFHQGTHPWPTPKRADDQDPGHGQQAA